MFDYEDSLSFALAKRFDTVEEALRVRNLLAKVDDKKWEVFEYRKLT